MATQKLVVAGSPGGTAAQARPMTPLDTTEVIPGLGQRSIDEVRMEIDDAFEHMKVFKDEEPDQIMRLAAGYSARLSYVRVLCMRIEDWYRPAKDLRTRELEPCIEELRNQYQVASRLHSVRELDWKMESGER
jgi:hypothetical protein